MRASQVLPHRIRELRPHFHLLATAGVILAVALASTGCGSHTETVHAVTGKAVFTDPLTNAIGQHATVVEPSAAAEGDTVVSVFQVGRTEQSGASAIGWATSTDGGSSWRQGLLPHVTVHQPEHGPFVRVSDPVVAHDRAHGQWVATYLVLKPLHEGFRVDVASSHSSNGLGWSDPLVITKGFAAAADKDWLTCGRHACYAVWTLPGYPSSRMASASTTDGGRTWSRARMLRQEGFGVQPVARPDGSVTVVTLGRERIEARSSTDGLRTLSAATTVGVLRKESVESLRTKIRSDVLPSAAIAPDGTEYAAWRRCRDDACSRTEIVMSTSADGRAWTDPRPVLTPDVDVFLPAVAVGRNARTLAVTFLSLQPHRCNVSDCRVRTYAVVSRDRGRTWRGLHPLSALMRLRDFPKVGGSFAFLGDYMDVTFTPAGTAIATYPVATARGAAYHQGIAVAAIRP